MLVKSSQTRSLQSTGFVQKLIQLTHNSSKKKRKWISIGVDAAVVTHDIGRKGDDSKRPILRPIICICNDLYASSLAKLRPHARIIRLSRPPDVHLVKRLRDICEGESLKAESRALSTLVGIAQGDLRGCLNTLQVLHHSPNSMKLTHCPISLSNVEGRLSQK